MNPEDRKALLTFARAALEEHLGLASPDDRPSLPVTSAPAGLFVALYKGDEPRGCIGDVIMHDTLPEALTRLSQEASFKDPKFPALRADEYPSVRLEISLLSPLKRIFFIEDIEPGRHGVYIHKGQQSGLLLPQVWKEVPDRATFLNALCRQKAGLPRGSWADPEVEMYVFTAEIVAEEKMN